MKQLTYRVLLKMEEEGGYTVTVPALPGCIPFGEPIDEAISMANEALMYISKALLPMENRFLMHKYWIILAIFAMLS